MKILLASPRGFCAWRQHGDRKPGFDAREFGPPSTCITRSSTTNTSSSDFVIVARSLSMMWKRCPTARLLFSRPRRVSGRSASVARERQSGHRRHLPVGNQSPSRSACGLPREGYTIVLIGHEGHDEVLGTMGEAPEAIVLVESETDVDQLDLPEDVQHRLPDANNSLRRRCQSHYRSLATTIPSNRRSAEG